MRLRGATQLAAVSRGLRRLSALLPSPSYGFVLPAVKIERQIGRFKYVHMLKLAIGIPQWA
jgi:hypothetical protein